MNESMKQVLICEKIVGVTLNEKIRLRIAKRIELLDNMVKEYIKSDHEDILKPLRRPWIKCKFHDDLVSKRLVKPFEKHKNKNSQGHFEISGRLY